MMLTVLSLLALTIMSVSGLEVAGNALIPRLEACGHPGSNCDTCGVGFVGCGQNTCFNPSDGETCCEAATNWVCPASHTCSEVRGQCVQMPALTMFTTSTTTTTATSTSPIAVVTTSAPAAPYVPVPTSLARVPPASVTVIDTSMVVPSPSNSTDAPTIQTTHVASDTTWNTSTALTIVANTTVPLVGSAPTSATPTMPLTSTSTTVLTPVSTATHTAASTSRAAPTSAASSAYVKLGFWKVMGLIGMFLATSVHQT